MKTKPENKILPHSEIDDQITHVSQDQLDELIEKGKTNGSLTYETVIAFCEEHGLSEKERSHYKGAIIASKDILRKSSSS